MGVYEAEEAELGRVDVADEIAEMCGENRASEGSGRGRRRDGSRCC